jgi:pimeloyl-ACP methyl ester carboxylesterase
MRTLLATCRDDRQREGVALSAYNTVENAADVDALRQALGYESMTLVGGSYGSHLALQIMRLYPRTVARAVLYGIEGPDHTWDNPAGMRATLERIAAKAEQSAALSRKIPEGGLLKTLARVIERLEIAPQTVAVTRGKEAKSVVVNADLVRWIARHRAGRRSAPYEWPEMILAMDRGDFSLAARAAADLHDLRLHTPMHYSMDCASGISEARRRRYQDDPAKALLGDINFEYAALCDAWPSRELGPTFRADVVSDIPTLILHGTWDTSTTIENAREVAASLRNGQLVEVVEGGHGALYNLYEHWPPMHASMRSFLTGERVAFPEAVRMPEVSFQPATRP